MLEITWGDFSRIFRKRFTLFECFELYDFLNEMILRTTLSFTKIVTLSVTFNTITLDLASYVDAHQKFPGSYLYKNEDEYTGLELVHKGCSRSAREQATCFGSSSGRSSGTARRSVICQNNGRCVERWNQPVCDCFTTLHTGSRCEKGERMRF